MEYEHREAGRELEPYFSRHMMAMTGEGLHSKGDIAAELAWRDKRVAELETALRFYADDERYTGPNQRIERGSDPYTNPDSPYMQDVTRDRGAIAKKALGGGQSCSTTK